MHSEPNRIYTIFDGDKDMWAYAYMKGWHVSPWVNFVLDDAHELFKMPRAVDENYVKSRLRQRMAQTKAFLVIVGESTKYLHRYVRWEIEEAIENDFPIIVINLNEKNGIDQELCPPILRKAVVPHIPFKADKIKHALSDFVAHYEQYKRQFSGPIYYPD